MAQVLRRLSCAPRSLRSLSTSPPVFLPHRTLHTTPAAAPRQRRTPRVHTSIVPHTSPAQARNSKRISLEVNGETISYDFVFLRDACRCCHCVHPSSQQKLFQTSEIPVNVHPLAAMTLADGALRITWDPESDIPGLTPHRKNHVSLYSADFLRRYSDARHAVRNRFNDRPQVLWDKATMEADVLWLDYEEYITSDEQLFKALTHLTSHGLFFLRNVPPLESSVGTIAERIGNIKHTLYGRLWDVKSLPDSKNIAYTSLNLGLHMDLLYFESPPGVQLLHSLRNSVIGGNSIFADSFRAATAVRMSSQMLWQSLLTFPVTFHYENDGHHYHHVHPTVVLDAQDYRLNKRISHVNYSPPFQAAFETGASDLQYAGRFRQFHNALKMFADGVDDPRAQLEVSLKEGHCAVFANRRVVHARREFDPDSGERWLRGAYVDTDAFLSRWRVLSARFKGSQYVHEESYEYVKNI